MKLILLTGSLALLGTLLGTRLAIHLLVRKGYGQYIRDDGPQEHLKKAGTPTMGGLAIIVSVVVAYSVAHLVLWQPPTASGIPLLGLLGGLGFVGFLDDWLKISRARSLGLNSKAKLFGQILVAVVAALAFRSQRAGLTPASPAVSFLRDIQWLHLPLPGHHLGVSSSPP